MDTAKITPQSTTRKKERKDPGSGYFIKHREEDHSSVQKSIFTFFSWELCGCHAVQVVEESNRQGRGGGEKQEESS